ncbi:8939_t:CDS:2 [Dentiscutata erythropus]|uniref:8939_t:CDS:1 n=1 Tax=Dentiscutata erythropus TaxID=1348616 RepID=A0A9N9GQZ3_9GLOM|nr:8939_t:CDS:2 [Dentiscutata erythropus]
MHAGRNASEPGLIKVQEEIKSGKNVAKIVRKLCEENNLDPKQCRFWLIDNMVYMSENKSGAIVKFNRQTNTSLFSIPYSLHVLQIALVAFKNALFRKLNIMSGLSL